MNPSSKPVGCARRSPRAVVCLQRSVVLLVGLGAAGVHAQIAAGGRSTTFNAGVDTQLSYVMDSRKGGIEGGDFVAELRPTLQLASRAGRVVGSLNYSLGLTHHSKPFDGERVQNQLNGQFSAEAIERWLYVDGSATVTQQAASAFGTQSVTGSTQDNPNRIEVGTVSLSPYVRGVFGSAVTYEARLNASGTNGRRSIAADSTQTGGSFTLSSAVSGSVIGWSLQAQSQTNDFRAGRETQSDRFSAALSFTADADLNLSLRAGQESTNVADQLKTTYNNWGAGATWRPSPRTRAQADFDERYFGNSYRVLLEHRLASSSIQWTSSRDVSNGADTTGAGQRTTLYQLWFNQFAAVQPDPDLRDVLVRDFLRANGQDPNTVVSGGFVNAAVSVQERHQLTLSYANTRLSGSFQVFSGKSTVIDVTATGPAAENPSNWGYLGTASYRLSPTASLALMGSRTLTRSTATQTGNELKSLSLTFTEQLGRRISANLSARYSVFNSPTDPYREAAVVASLSQRF